MSNEMKVRIAKNRQAFVMLNPAREKRTPLGTKSAYSTQYKEKFTMQSCKLGI